MEMGRTSFFVSPALMEGRAVPFFTPKVLPEGFTGVSLPSSLPKKMPLTVQSADSPFTSTSTAGLPSPLWVRLTVKEALPLASKETPVFVALSVMLPRPVTLTSAVVFFVEEPLMVMFAAKRFPAETVAEVEAETLMPAAFTGTAPKTTSIIMAKAVRNPAALLKIV